MGQKYLASLLAVAMFAAGVPCAQAEELDTNTANITGGQTIQGEDQGIGPSDEGTVSSNETDDALSASADSQIAGRTVENIDKGWMFSKGDASMDGWTFPTGASEGTIDLPHSWDYGTLRCRIFLSSTKRPSRIASSLMSPSTMARTCSSSSTVPTRTPR